MERESLRLLLAQGQSVEQIAKRFGKHPSTVAYWMAKHGLVAPNRESTPHGRDRASVSKRWSRRA